MTSSTAARRMLVSAVFFALASVALAGPVAAAKPHRCVVVNVATGERFRHVQPAVNRAAAGAKLRLKGTCVGTILITRDLKIVGHRKPGFGPPILDGDGQGPVVTVGGDGVVTLKGLRIRHGEAGSGGGLQVGRDATPGNPSVTLVDSVVKHNSATDSGGGISVEFGTLDIVDSIVRDNTSMLGGGIDVGSGADPVTLRGTSVVTGNHASGDGGGIAVAHFGRLLLLDRSSVDHNTADQYGGGVSCGDCDDAALFDDAEVHHNTAGLGGGGLNSGGLGTTHVGDRSSIHENSAPVGGGVRLIGNGVALSGTSSIRLNTSTEAGGGVYLDVSGSVQLTEHSSIDHNATAGNGGGVAIGAFGFVDVADDAIITANSASQGGGTYIEVRGRVTLSGNGAITGNLPDDCSPPDSVAGCGP